MEIAQAAYQLHFVLFFDGVPREERESRDVPYERWKLVNATIPGMRNTCFSYNEESEDVIREHGTPIKMRDQKLPSRDLP